MNAQNPKDNFTFKCHRSNGTNQGYQDIYAVNDIAFHPVHGTLATVGSDGRYSFWDKDARTKLKTSEAMDQPITCCTFSSTGNVRTKKIIISLWRFQNDLQNLQVVLGS